MRLPLIAYHATHIEIVIEIEQAAKLEHFDILQYRFHFNHCC